MGTVFAEKGKEAKISETLNPAISESREVYFDLFVDLMCIIT